MLTLAEVLTQGEGNLAAAGIDNPRREVRRVAAAVLDIDEATVLARPERGLTQAEAEAFYAALAKREAGMPLSRILRRREFWSLTFEVTPAVLDPRPDSETLIEAALRETADRTAALRILDLGTGSGCLLLALLSEIREATGLGVDVCAQALEVARENARNLGLDRRATFRQGDWASGLQERFDVLLCNPPYVGEAEYRALETTVTSFEPSIALVPGGLRCGDGEATGLEAYETLLPAVKGLLKPSGRAYFEIGWRQGATVLHLAKTAGFSAPRLLNDLAGRPRCLVLHAWD